MNAIIHSAEEPLFAVVGTLLQFVSTPEQNRANVSVMRGGIPPRAVIPLHSHADPEIFYLTQGTMDVFQDDGISSGWQTATVGDVVTIAGRVKHALRNSGSTPVTAVLVSEERLYRFFRELAKPLEAAATKRVLAAQDGPCILVAHSYGGAVITEAETDPSVVGLVYIAAHMPDAGENESDDGKRFPSDLSKSNAIKKTADGFTYLDPAQFHEYFAADLSAEQAAFMARSQVMNKVENFKGVITTPAWRSKPSWMLVAGSDRTINPDLERWYATRAGSHKVEIPGASHSVYVSHPREVAALIEDAAQHVR